MDYDIHADVMNTIDKKFLFFSCGWALVWEGMIHMVCFWKTMSWGGQWDEKTQDCYLSSNL